MLVQKLKKIIFGDVFVLQAESTIFMFAYSSSLKILNFNSFNAPNVIDMSYMLYSCSALIELDLSSFDTSNVTDASYMLYNIPSTCKIYVGSKWTLNESDTGFKGSFIYV